VAVAGIERPNMYVDVLGSNGPWIDSTLMVMLALSYRLMVISVFCGMRAVLLMVTLKYASVPSSKVSSGYPVWLHGITSAILTGLVTVMAPSMIWVGIGR